MRRKQILCPFLFACLSLALIAAAPLNPTVKLVPHPAAQTAPECEQGLAPQPPVRVDASQIPAPPPAPSPKPVSTPTKHRRAALVAPPSRSLKGLLRITQTATQQNDVNAFRDSLTAVKSTLADYPRGGERDAATSVVDVWEDLARVWQFSFDSPTGAFFDSSSEIYPIVKRYPGFDAALRRQIVVDPDGRRIYPTAETRDYLAGEAAKRLGRLGVAGVRIAANDAHAVLPHGHRNPVVTEPGVSVSTTAATPAIEHTGQTRPIHHPSAKHPHEPAAASTKAQASSAPAHHRKPADHTTMSDHTTTSEARSSSIAGTTTTASSPTKGSTVGTATAPGKSASASALAVKSSSQSERKPQPAKSATSPALSTQPVATSSTTGNAVARPSASASTSTTPVVTSASSALPPASVTTVTTTVASTTTPMPVDSTIATGTTPPAAATTSPSTTTDATTQPTTTAATSSSTSVADPTTTTATPAQPSNGRGMLLPIILIVIGLGVLIVLFRASN